MAPKRKSTGKKDDPSPAEAAPAAAPAPKKAKAAPLAVGDMVPADAELTREDEEVVTLGVSGGERW